MTPEGIDAQANILVMDDEAHIRDITEKMLKRFGHGVTLTPDGETAVAAYQRTLDQGTPFDLVIMDLLVPGGMDGKEASRQILAMDPKARILIASGDAFDPAIADYKTFGLKGILHKPFRMADLQAAVLRHIP